ncbi:SulP family sulfate permease [Natronobacillus azotifigens]|uniref:Sulfate permease n=1 Tax=Natronobacillus azotifigens TaxID=472978 RepID=A0A9J6RHM8_9BACI|nr:sulfate permease [Natronobacillus azotifigens]MCZ0704625.1 sulfate permease [Natronobacillus azotifigens]
MLKRIIPALEWIPNYNKMNLTGDLSAGLIVAIMLIPQGMAYAMLAQLPPVYGLYASTIPLVIYALFGTSRQLAVGPVAMVSLLVLTGVTSMAEPGTNTYISLVLLLMLLSGILQFLMGVLKIGSLIHFIPHSVISGFTSAAAILIGLSQLNYLLGIDLNTNKGTFHVLFELPSRMNEVHLITLSIGLFSMLLLILLKRTVPKLPAQIVVVVLSVLVLNLFQLQQQGVEIVGEIPRGLPSLSIPRLDMTSIRDLFLIALAVALIGFMESIAMAKVIAAKEGYNIEPNQELIAIGLSNIGGAFFSGSPVAGSLSRSAVNHQAGAKTPLATIITAIIISLTLLFFTDLFYYLPHAVLAAIIIVAISSLIDTKTAVQLFRNNRPQGWTWVMTFVATLTLGVETGLVIGILYACLVSFSLKRRSRSVSKKISSRNHSNSE